ncbi:MAG: hypothetical protein ACREI3_05185 [Nitrospirales bacterium]
MRWILILVMLYAVYKLVQPWINELMGNRELARDRDTGGEAPPVDREQDARSARRRPRSAYDLRGVAFYLALVVLALMALLYLQEGRFLP